MLSVFEGPLDLLLRLIEREELDISQVSLALVADQYLEYVATLRQVAAADLADFLVVAAKLLVIKSRALLPRADDASSDEDEEGDPGEELARQLIEYKRFKEAASRLRALEEAGQREYPRVAPPPQLERRLEPGDVSLLELLDALKRALEAHPPVPPVDDVVAPVVVHITDCLQNITTMVQKHPRVTFTTLMRRARSRLEVIVTFLALLELVKLQRVRVTQDQPFGEIVLEAREPDPDAVIEPLDLSEYGEGDADGDQTGAAEA